MVGRATHETSETILSSAAADLVTGVLAGQLTYLQENGVKPRTRAGRNVVQLYSPELYEPDYDDEYLIDEVYREQQKAGYVKDVVITTELGTDRITSAELSVVLPASLTMDQAAGFYRGDGWRARLQFPSPKADATSRPRAVLDTWRLPYTEVSMAARALTNSDDDSRASFDALHRGVFYDKDAAGIAPEARDVTHVVLGREDELDPATYELVKAVLGFFDHAVRDQVAMIDMTRRAEQVTDSDPTTLRQLRVVLGGIRAARQQHKSEIESPFDLLKTGSMHPVVKKLRRERQLTPDAEARKAAQIAAGPAVRAARAAKRAAAEHTSGQL